MTRRIDIAFACLALLGACAQPVSESDEPEPGSGGTSGTGGSGGSGSLGSGGSGASANSGGSAWGAGGSGGGSPSGGSSGSAGTSASDAGGGLGGAGGGASIDAGAGGGCQDCILALCGPALDTCLNTPSCVELVDCAQASGCGASDYTCVYQKCSAHITSASAGAALGVLDCVAGSCGTSCI